MTRPLIMITGASSGIGEATARAFSSAGHPLSLLARRLERIVNRVSIAGRKVYPDHTVCVGIPASYMADTMLFACQMPQNQLIHKMVVTPTRQEF